METTFENAVVGDKVWDEYYQGYGEIALIHSNLIEVRFETRVTAYHKDGVMRGALHRTLYWGKLVIPERPKRKVKKVIEGWLNIYTENLHPTEEVANMRRIDGRLGKADFIYHEYEVEE